MRRWSFSLLSFGLLLLAGCHIEDHTPTGSRWDEAAIRDVVAAFFVAANRGDGAGLRALFDDHATIELSSAGAPSDSARARGFVTPDEYRALHSGAPEAKGGARVLRSDFRQMGDLAGVWVTYRTAEAPASTRVDHFLLRRAPDGWRIVHLATTVLPAGIDP